MSQKNAYLRFIDHMKGWILGLPDSDDLVEILELSLSPEEAEFLADLPFLPHSIEQLAAKFNMGANELSPKLDLLAGRGLVFRHESKNTVRYALNDSMLAFFRAPFWAGKRDEKTRKLAISSNRYFYGPYGREFGSHPTMGLRAIPIDRTIKDARQIWPYEDVLQVVEKEDYFVNSHCNCRMRHNLDPDSSSCSHETFNCLHFGRLARYMVKHGMGKEISREEVLETLQAAADAGLVHGISNTKAGMDSICNCCSCCCLLMESFHVNKLRGHQPSNYVIEISSQTCKGCGLCVERCPMSALQLQDSPEAKNKLGKISVLDSEQCIGCGVCAHKCPTQSLSLVPREHEQNIPENFRDMAQRMARERRRDCGV